MKRIIALAGVAAVLAACDSDSNPTWDAADDVGTDTDATGDGGGDVPYDGTSDPDTEPLPPWGARLTGVVWGPNRLFPVSGALVAAYIDRPDDISEFRYCEPCIDLPAGVPNTTSNPDGTFTLEVEPGVTYWLTVQKGQFRRVREYTAPGEIGEYTVEENLTTLPNVKDQDIGDMIPNIALLYGDYDALEDVLGKGGIGAVNSSFSFEWGSEEGVFDVFDNSSDMVDPHGEPRNDLLLNPGRMAGYHVIFFPCSYNAIFEWMENETIQDNLRDYVRSGGKIYVSDYAYTVADIPWSDFLWFDDPLHGGCTENQFPDGCNHGPPFDAPSRSPDEDLSEWLLAVDEDSSTTDWMAEFETMENWDTIGGIFDGYMGDDYEGFEIWDTPKVWVEGTWNYDAEDVDPDWDWDTYHPFTVSWQYGCGRVLYTTYHTVGTTDGGKHPGLYTQEKILWYLIMELQVCQEIELI